MFLWNKCQGVQWVSNMLGAQLTCKESISQESFIAFSMTFRKTGEIWVFFPWNLVLSLTLEMSFCQAIKLYVTVF